MLSLLQFANRGVRGLVVDQKGVALAGVIVGFTDISSSEWAGKNVTTSEQGEFWKLLLPGDYSLQAWHSDCVHAEKVQVRVNRMTVKNIVVRRKSNCI